MTTTKLKHVDHITRAVAAPIVAATKSADQTILSLAATITTLVEEVAVRRVDPRAGAAQLPLIAAALQKQAEARCATIDVRIALFAEARRRGVVAYGPDCICIEPNDTSEAVQAREDAPIAS